jgi:hypothetical protein
MEVIQKLNNHKMKRQKNMTLIVIRIGKEGDLKNSMPCTKCIDYIKTTNDKRYHQIKNIYFSNTDGNLEYVSLNTLSEQTNQHLSKRFR